MDSTTLRQLVWKPEESAKLDFKIELYKIYEPKPTTQSDIQEWVKAKEQQWAELIKDVIALANGNTGTAAQTGYLVVGADDKLKADGTPTLRDVGNAIPTRKEILQKINSYCQPRLPDIQCEEVVVDGIKLFVVSIPPSPYLHRLSKQLKTPKKEYSPYTVLIRRGDGEETYEASPKEQIAIEKEKQSIQFVTHIKARKRLIITLFAALTGGLIFFGIISNYINQTSDSIQVSSVKTVGDSKTEIREFGGGQGIISVYWEVYLSNLGNRDLSVINYKVIQVGKDFPANWYTGMDQGLYLLENGETKRLELPINIQSGSTQKIFVRLGLMMTPEVSKLVKEKFVTSSNSDVTLKTIWRFLYTKGTDFYGNKVTTEVVDSNGKIISRFPSIEDVREQTFLIYFTTSRRKSIEKLLSWYKFGGAYDPNRYR
ncbi:ATP-binding protein (plasmid) [Tolypothrix sp. PCC 7712]|uniref:AlbA family DNA-binding domain-containing protein n=1 Tax=Tolypothrix sp. PCC 7712 TaxID=2596898 RepID=UPI0021F75670|nr:ATP-binding protein [Tolypothrix sp. PCC 7712]UYD31072.1 ATP-binding protein [Tolypothrix sp. PCC 7712]